MTTQPTPSIPVPNNEASALAWSMFTTALDSLAKFDQARLVSAMSHVEARVRDTHYPPAIAHISLAADRLTLGDDSNDLDEVRFECPWCRCKDISITMVDRGERWTEMDQLEQANIADREIVFDYQSGTDMHDSYVKCDVCNNPISLPDGWNDRAN